MISPALMRRCTEDGRTITYLDFAGRFRARVEGPVSGNVLLRQAQYRALDDEARSLDFARSFVLGKLQNTRQVLLRSARDLGYRNEKDWSELVPLEERRGLLLWRLYRSMSP